VASGPGRSLAEIALATPIYSSAGVMEGIGYPMYMRGGEDAFLTPSKSLFAG
jgi:hypothetical protein